MNLDDDDTIDELPARSRQAIPAADRALLELAARALGAVHVEDVEGENWLNLHFADGSVIYAWNSLVHGDDTFNLAVDLKLGIAHLVVGGCRVEVFLPEGRLVHEFYEDDGREAARRAVTRAAAQIHRQRS